MLNHCPHFKIFTSRSGERKPDDHNLGTKTSLENNYLSCGDASHIPFASYTENEDTRAARPLSDIELMEKKKKTQETIWLLCHRCIAFASCFKASFFGRLIIDRRYDKKRKEAHEVSDFASSHSWHSYYGVDLLPSKHVVWYDKMKWTPPHDSWSMIIFALFMWAKNETRGKSVSVPALIFKNRLEIFLFWR